MTKCEGMTILARTSAPSPTELREAFSHFPQGVALIGAEVDGAPFGLIASTLTVGVSLDPPLVSIAVQNTSTTWPFLRTAPALGISLLGVHQSQLAGQLASTNRAQRFVGIDPAVTDDGALTIPDSPALLWTRLYSEVEAGDHMVVLLEILDSSSTEGEDALIFHRSEFKEMRVS